jgi:hypothetical protein
VLGAHSKTFEMSLSLLAPSIKLEVTRKIQFPLSIIKDCANELPSRNVFEELNRKEKFFLWVGVFEVERYLGRGFEVERCNSEVELLSTNYSKTNVVLR